MRIAVDLVDFSDSTTDFSDAPRSQFDLTVDQAHACKEPEIISFKEGPYGLSVCTMNLYMNWIRLYPVQGRGRSV